jgi:hypothetical protein
VLPRGGEGSYSSTMGLPEGRNKGYLEEVVRGQRPAYRFLFCADPDSQIRNPNFSLSWIWVFVLACKITGTKGRRVVSLANFVS